MTIIRVGVGPGDPDLLTVRAVDVLAEAAVVVATPELTGLVRSFCRPDVPLLPPRDLARAVDLAGEGVVVELVSGDGLVAEIGPAAGVAGPVETAGATESAGVGIGQPVGPAAPASPAEAATAGLAGEVGPEGTAEAVTADAAAELTRGGGLRGTAEAAQGNAPADLTDEVGPKGTTEPAAAAPAVQTAEAGAAAGLTGEVGTAWAAEPTAAALAAGAAEPAAAAPAAEAAAAAEVAVGAAAAGPVVAPAKAMATGAPSGVDACVVGGVGGAAAPTRETAPDEVVPGLPADVGRRVLAVLRDPRAARPLLGLSVVVTRAAAQAAELSRPLRRRGARVIEVPTIRIDAPADGGRALQRAVDRIESYDWLIVTSVNGARALLDRLPDGRRLAGVRLAAIGPATAATMAAAHLPVDLVPPRYVAESLLEVFPAPSGGAAGGPRRERPTSGRADPPRVLLARAAVARDTLPAGLEALGWRVDVVEAYRTVSPDLPSDVIDEVGGADVACFTAPSTFERFCALVGEERLPPHLACIGPVTAAAVRSAGLEPSVEAEVHTMPGLVDALTAWAVARPAAAANP